MFLSEFPNIVLSAETKVNKNRKKKINIYTIKILLKVQKPQKPKEPSYKNRITLITSEHCLGIGFRLLDFVCLFDDEKFLTRWNKKTIRRISNRTYSTYIEQFLQML